VNWDPFQRAALAELGHVLYRVPGAVSVLPPAGIELDAAPAAAGAANDAMLARLARAARVAPEALRGHADIVAAAAGLRGDAAAKRALWPRLRALRRAAG
jgi:hypothetical protein